MRPAGGISTRGISVPEIPNNLPILPLRESVLFPLAVMPIAVGQERSLRMIDDVMRTSRVIGLVAQRRAQGGSAGPEDLYRVGTAAVIHQLLRNQDGSVQLVVQGLERFRIAEFAQSEPYLIARIQPAPEVESSGDEVEALARTVRSVFERWLALRSDMQAELGNVLEHLGGNVQAAYFVAATVPLPATVREEILEADSSAGKLRRLVEVLQHEIAILELQKKITSETTEQISKSQREFMLREQMRTIQRELGESDSQNVEARELRQKVNEANLPAEARKECERELERLGQMPSASPEFGIIRTFLEWMVSLPWAKTSGGAIDIAKSRDILDEDHYDLEKIKERILDYLAVQKLREERKVQAPFAGDGSSPLPTTQADEARREPILCFVGAPGVGKTSLGQSIARAMGRKFVRVSLGGVHDEAEIRGHRRTYIGAMPGRILQALRRAETRDPVFMLDEIDKMSASFHGDPAAALLEVLDPAQNQSFVDTYLGVPFDLSRVLFICTANTVDTIPAPLLDRMEVLALSGYTEEEKLHIAKRYLLPKQIAASGLRPGELKVDDEVIRRVIRDYTREAGVRNLERQLATLARKAARRISEGSSVPVLVGIEQVTDFLGRRRFYNELAERIDRPGIATGLAWTPVGGEVLFVEATMVPGHESLLLTGMLGEVMKESAQAALSFVRSSAERLAVDPKVFEGKSIHVHVPAGAIPKDGPSAGVAMMTALASLAKGVPVRNDVAMTGEITLRGKILPVGGIKEKVLAAYRAGVKAVILPLRNEDQLEDVPEEVRRSMRVVLVDSAEQVLETALSDAQPRTAESAGRGARTGS